MRIPVNTLATLGTLCALAACGESTGVGGPDNVSVNFRVSQSAASLSAPSTVSGVADLGGPLVIEGTNGALTIDEVRLIVSEVELEREYHDSCPADDPRPSGGGSDDSSSGSGSDDGCEKFDVGPQFLDLPLDGDPVEVMTDLVPPGVYDELEFEIEDLEDDEEDSVERAKIAAVRAEVLALIPDWPRKASVLVTGTFTPNDGDPVDFRVFLEAEIEIEMDLVPSLVIDDGGASRDLTVDIDPGSWFKQSSGAVLDLSQFDFDATGKLLEIEVDLEHGFTKIEVDDGP